MKFFIVASNSKGYYEVVSTHDTKEEAEKALFKCIEGDDKYDPLYYSIEQREY
jgi:hypothetical protein